MTRYTLINADGTRAETTYDSATAAVLAGFALEADGILEPGWDWGVA